MRFQASRTVGIDESGDATTTHGIAVDPDAMDLFRRTAAASATDCSAVANLVAASFAGFPASGNIAHGPRRPCHLLRSSLTVSSGAFQSPVAIKRQQQSIQPQPQSRQPAGTLGNQGSRLLRSGEALPPVGDQFAREWLA